MHTAFIVSPMLVSGIALFGSAVWIQADRNALINAPGDEPTPIRASISALGPAEATVVREELEPVTIELEAIEVIGRRRVAKPATPAPAVGQLVAEPCSAWDEIGPERVIDGKPVGSRRVRELCPRLLPVEGVPNSESTNSLVPVQH